MWQSLLGGLDTTSLPSGDRGRIIPFYLLTLWRVAAMPGRAVASSPQGKLRPSSAADTSWVCGGDLERIRDSWESLSCWISHPWSHPISRPLASKCNTFLSCLSQFEKVFKIATAKGVLTDRPCNLTKCYINFDVYFSLLFSLCEKYLPFPLL